MQWEPGHQLQHVATCPMGHSRSQRRRRRRSPSLVAHLLLACLLLTFPGVEGRRLTQAGQGAPPPASLVPLQRQQQVEGEDPLMNAVRGQSVEPYRKMPGKFNDPLLVFKIDRSARFRGSRFMPLTYEDLMLVTSRLTELALPHVFCELTSYREFHPDLAAPPSIQERTPGVDVGLTVYYVLNATHEAEVPEELFDSLNSFLLTLIGSMTEQLFVWGNGTDVYNIQVNHAVADLAIYTRPTFTLHPVIVLNALLSLTLSNMEPGVPSSRQVYLVTRTLEATVRENNLGTLVEAIYTSHSNSMGVWLLQLEVTLFYCRENATEDSPQCEQRILDAVLYSLLKDEATMEEWRDAGIAAVNLRAISQRQPPANSPDAIVAPTEEILQVLPQGRAPVRSHSEWVPWHLDRIDQRDLPLDGRFNANALGTGVHIYIISSGVRADHEEFRHLNGSPGSRVVSEWGYLGLNPLEDCPDASFWYGQGTYSASLCCGLTLGPAKNASIHSLRFRAQCVRTANQNVWSEGALPSALDLVLSSGVKPAVVLIDTWWKPRGQENPAPLIARLDRLLVNNWTVVAPVGAGDISPCENVIARHPAVIAVAAMDTYDQHTARSPDNSSCIDVFAPGGGLGTGMVGADSSGPGNYTHIVAKALGAAPLVAGVAAQYLQLHPDASPAEVRRALLDDMATQGAVLDAGPASPNKLLYTDFTQNTSAMAPASNSSGTSNSGSSGGLTVGTIATIATVVIVAVTGSVVLGYVLVGRRRRVLKIDVLKQVGTGWEVAYDDIQICRRSDGSEWLLGEGRYGRVYKAIKGDVQVVAVKKMTKVKDRFKALFAKEIDMMKYVSRDANVTQFYGACIRGDDMMLVLEYMEGGDLRRALEGSDGASLLWHKRGQALMLDIVRGVHFLHACNVVHCDVKSQNILLDSRRSRAKVADVGLAQLLDSSTIRLGPPSESNSDSFVGTLAWAAPEAVMGQALTNKADIYSLGVVLWELVTQEVPQRGRLREVEVPQECPQEVADIIAACMQQDPEARPSALELYALLADCPPGSALDAGPDEPFALGREGNGSDRRGEGGSSLGEDLVREQSKRGEEAISGSLSSPDLALAVIGFDKVEFCQDSIGALIELGMGAFGKVYKVLLEGVQPLAAKCVELGEEPAVHEAFLREAGMLWRLRHVNLVTLSGVAFSGGQAYLLMELMEAGSLHRLLNAQSRQSKQRMFAWYNRGRQVALEVASALHYLHSLKVTHFDLKPANILLTKSLNAKVADVGLARVMSCTHHSLNTEKMGPPGTFNYMAPELMAGTKCTEKVDVYSFGITLWELCSGKPPVRGQMAPLRVPEDCPQEVADLYKECTAADPAARPSSRELVQRLTVARQASGGAQRKEIEASPV